MKLVANIQQKPTTTQANSLRDTLERCNAACNAISQRGFEAGKTRKYDLQNLLYRDIRDEFGLTAQAALPRSATSTPRRRPTGAGESPGSASTPHSPMTTASSGS